MIKKILLYILILIQISLLYGCRVVKPLYNGKTVVNTEYGDVFSVGRIVDNVPDQEISIGASYNGVNIFSTSLSNFLLYYDYQNDIINNWDKIIGSRKETNIRVYQFYWGIVYTLDNGESFSGVAKHEYSNQYQADEGFARAYKLIDDEPFYDKKYKEYLDPERSDLPEKGLIGLLKKDMSIQNVMGIIGKASRYLGTVTDTDIEGNIIGKREIFEYDLIDQDIAIVLYENRDTDQSPELCVSYIRVR